MFKVQNLFLQMKQYFEAKKVSAHKETVNYPESKRIGILFKVDEPEAQRELNKFISILKKDKKDIVALSLVHPTKEVENELKFDYQTFSRKDVSLFGDINSEELKTFMETSFDYLYCISASSLPIFDYMMLKSKAKCRIGKYDSSLGHELYEMMIGLQDTTDVKELIRQSLFYTKVITQNRKENQKAVVGV